MRQLHEHKRSRHKFISGNVVRLSKRYPPRKAAPVHTMWLLNFQSGMDNSNTA